MGSWQLSESVWLKELVGLMLKPIGTTSQCHKLNARQELNVITSRASSKKKHKK